MSHPDREARKRLYRTERWRQVSLAHLKANPACCDCGGKARVTDHALGHGHGWRDRFFIGPFDSRCWPCHSRKTARFEQGHKADGSFARAGQGGGQGQGGDVSKTSDGSPSTHMGTKDFLGRSGRSVPADSTTAMAARMRAAWTTATQPTPNEE